MSALTGMRGVVRLVRKVNRPVSSHSREAEKLSQRGLSQQSPTDSCGPPDAEFLAALLEVDGRVLEAVVGVVDHVIG
jgi:hypothetical protein